MFNFIKKSWALVWALVYVLGPSFKAQRAKIALWALWALIFRTTSERPQSPENDQSPDQRKPIEALEEIPGG